MHKESHSDKHKDYFQAILQLRPNDEKLLNFVLAMIKERKNVKIAKKVVLKTGIDLYLSDQRFARALGQKLKKSFKGKLILSRQLHSRDRMSSKDIYRVTVCFRLNEEKRDPEVNFSD